MRDWRFWFAEQRGTFMAIAIFLVMFVIYASNHPAGFTANVVQTASNKGVLLAFVAMAQALVVITAGIDLSVGMIFTLTNCLASWLVTGSPLQVAFGILAVLFVGALCGAINGTVVIYGRLQPIVATIATGAIYYGVALALRPFPGINLSQAWLRGFPYMETLKFRGLGQWRRGEERPVVAADHAANGIPVSFSAFMAGYQRRNVSRNSFLSTCARTCSKR